MTDNLFLKLIMCFDGYLIKPNDAAQIPVIDVLSSFKNFIIGNGTDGIQSQKNFNILKIDGKYDKVLSDYLIWGFIINFIFYAMYLFGI